MSDTSRADVEKVNEIASALIDCSKTPGYAIGAWCGYAIAIVMALAAIAAVALGCAWILDQLWQLVF